MEKEKLVRNIIKLQNAYKKTKELLESIKTDRDQRVKELVQKTKPLVGKHDKKLHFLDRSLKIELELQGRDAKIWDKQTQKEVKRLKKLNKLAIATARSKGTFKTGERTYRVVLKPVLK